MMMLLSSGDEETVQSCIYTEDSGCVKKKTVTNWNGRLFQELSFARKLFKFWIRKQCL